MSLKDPKPIVKGIKAVKDAQDKRDNTGPAAAKQSLNEDKKRRKRTAAQIVYGARHPLPEEGK